MSFSEFIKVQLSVHFKNPSRVYFFVKRERKMVEYSICESEEKLPATFPFTQMKLNISDPKLAVRIYKNIFLISYSRRLYKVIFRLDGNRWKLCEQFLQLRDGVEHINMTLNSFT